ncbi:MAG: ABC transporter permease [Oliverpabstia sp.]|nr:ABC transporter permease [Oliverpabstia sp.]
MSRGFYSKLAVNGLKKNSRIFLPYILACIGTIGIFQVFSGIALNPHLDSVTGGYYISIVLSPGIGIVGIFSAIFLFYTNSFLIRQRKQELALYNMLGMGKFHLARMLFWESLLVTVICLVLGEAVGILLSRLMFLFLLKIVNIPSQLDFSVTFQSVKITLLLFSGIFLLNFLNTLWNIRKTSPVELLQGSRQGEKEPKTKWLMALAGVILTGIGYYIAITANDPFQAISGLFIAVLLVIIGTYALFTAGSILVLKAMKKNAGFYYKKKHFISVSGMIYRMKQNAAGLASICVLSTAVLLVVSTTVSLYFGNEDAIQARYPNDISAVFYGVPQEQMEQIVSEMENVVAEAGLQIKNERDYSIIAEGGIIHEGEFLTETTQEILSTDEMCQIYFLDSEQYKKLTGKTIILNEKEDVGLYVFRGNEMKNLKAFGENLKVRQVIEDFPAPGRNAAMAMNTYYIIMKDRETLNQLLEKRDSTVKYSVAGYRNVMEIDITGTPQEKIAVSKKLDEIYSSQYTGEEFYFGYLESQDGNREEIFVMNGTFFFLGILLGLVFLLGTVLIIYYKQISEGYADKKRFEIMEKVGMSQKEVRQSIRSQVLKVFFLPLVMAVIHICAAFPLMTRLLEMLNLNNHQLFFGCTCVTILVFTVLYGIVYSLTARTYYKIVR